MGPGLKVRLKNAYIIQCDSYDKDDDGNITEIRDDAQQTIFFNNTVVEPHGAYTYDALYRKVYCRMYQRLQPLYREIREITGYPGRR